jgi:hypothetical protein
MACVRKRNQRYVLDFLDQTGERRRISLPKGATKAEAKEELRIYGEQVLKGMYLPEKKIPTFKQVAADWIEHKRASLRENTWEVYEGHVRNHFGEFDSQKITTITTAKVEKFINRRQTDGMNILTIRKILVTLGQIFAYAVRHRYIEYNPLRDAERPQHARVGSGYYAYDLELFERLDNIQWNACHYLKQRLLESYIDPQTGKEPAWWSDTPGPSSWGPGANSHHLIK